MKNKLILFIATAFLLISANAYSSELPEILIVEDNWPTKTCNDQLINIKFSFLNFKLPQELIKEIEIFNFSSASVAITLNDEQSHNIFLIAQTEESVIGPLYEKLSVRTKKDFFNKIGEKSKDNPNLKKAKKVFGINDAEGYIKSKKGKITSYFIKSTNINERYIYIIVEGDKNIYQINGFINNEIYKTLLSNLSV